MKPTRYLLIIADDFGIGPATSQGILDLAAEGLVTGTVLLANSPHAADAMQRWRQAAVPLEIGWHPCLTLDRPVLPPEQVPTLVDSQGIFWPLGALLRRLYRGQVRAAEVAAELQAQHDRCCTLLGRLPSIINGHHHIHIFRIIGAFLRAAAADSGAYMRQVCEPWALLAGIPGARAKRTFLSTVGRCAARRQTRLGIPGNQWLAGVTDPPLLRDPAFFCRWIAALPGTVVELGCHPGHKDDTLIGRDCTATDGQQQRRVRELELLRDPGFRAACAQAGFTLIAPAQLPHSPAQAERDAVTRGRGDTETEK